MPCRWPARASGIRRRVVPPAAATDRRSAERNGGVSDPPLGPIGRPTPLIGGSLTPPQEVAAPPEQVGQRAARWSRRTWSVGDVRWRWSVAVAGLVHLRVRGESTSACSTR
jgi:hypothetical protein